MRSVFLALMSSLWMDLKLQAAWMCVCERESVRMMKEALGYIIDEGGTLI